MLAPQHPDGLRLSVYSYKLAGGNGGRDIREANVLLHSLGLRDLAEAEFTEFQWIPFVVGAVGLLLLRCAVLGNLSTIVDLLVLFAYFGLFSLWSFGYKLHEYGRSLATNTAANVPPFAPPIFGHTPAGDFQVFSFPGPGTYALLAAFLLSSRPPRGSRGAKRARDSLLKPARRDELSAVKAAIGKAV
jgi:hypothetical protein